MLRIKLWLKFLQKELKRDHNSTLIQIRFLKEGRNTRHDIKVDTKEKLETDYLFYEVSYLFTKRNTKSEIVEYTKVNGVFTLALNTKLKMEALMVSNKCLYHFFIS